MTDYGIFLKKVKAKGIADDSRSVKKGDVFVAIKGEHADGNDFIDDAIAKGAVAVVSEEPARKEYTSLKYLRVENAREALALLASEFYGNPSRKLRVIGVTGSDGKTTTSHMIYEMFLASGKKVGLITTISAKIGTNEIDTGFHVTSPEPLALQKILKDMVDAGLNYLILEVTSHGIRQHRVDGINFDVAVLTNITHEHLDYHKSFSAYRDTKLQLFLRAKTSVLNKDDKSYSYFASKIRSPKATYSLKAGGDKYQKSADYFASGIEISERMKFNVSDSYGTHTIRTGLIGEYNVQNALAAIATARYFDINWDKITTALSKIKNPKGRLEKIANKKGIDIYIDFAHTPNALQNVLALLAKKAAGKLIAVFGCASERDDQKRPMMGRISTDIADVSVFTAEDPRREDINKILSEMEAGVKNKKAKYHKIPERGEAISFAINKLAKPGDTVVVCGKAHETSMAYNGVEYPWSDFKAVEMALEGKVLEIKR